MKTRITNYTFNPEAKTVTFNDYTTIDRESILSIENKQTGSYLYIVGSQTKKAKVAENILTLNAAVDTSTMSSADDLLIYYDDALLDGNDNKRLLKANDSVTAYRGADVVMIEGKAYYPAPIVANVAASQTDSVLVQRVSGKRIKVLFVVCQAGATATNLTFNSKANGIAGTAISQVFQNAPNAGEVLQPNEYGWFDTNLNEALTVTTGAGSTTGITGKYIYY